VLMILSILFSGLLLSGIAKEPEQTIAGFNLSGFDRGRPKLIISSETQT